MNSPLVLVLAAGRSRRFGSDKRQARLPSGQSVLEATLAQVRAAGLEARVVVAPGDSLAMSAETLIAANAALGMGHSIADAVAQLTSVPGCLILPADMPFVAPETLAAVAAALSTHLLAAPVLGRRRGHPVGFSAQLFPELLRLQGDTGARVVLERHASQIAEVAVSDPGILIDIDTRESLTGP